MADGEVRSRLLGVTRGRVLGLLRRSAQTVGDVARQLALTDNAVRLHLGILEREGLVEQAGTRSEWTGKPAVLYRSTQAAEGLYPKPYPQVLGELLRAVRMRHGEAEVARLAREAGLRLGTSAGVGGGSRAERFARAAEVLNALGGLAEVQETEGGLRLQGYSCPLGSVTGDHPELCQLAESLVGALVGEPVVECCERGERPRCAFRPAAEAPAAE